jgi:PAS domain S-box-containing protein
VAGNSNNARVISLLASRTHSSRNLVLGLFSILIVTAGGFGYFMVEFRNQSARAAFEISSSASRDSLLLASYQLTLDSYYIAEKVFRNPTDRHSLQPFYFQKLAGLRDAQNRYEGLLNSLAVETSDIRHAAKSYFDHVDSLVVPAALVFDAKVSPTKKLELPRESRVLFEIGVYDYFRRLRNSREELLRLELAANSEEASRTRNLTENAAHQWFAVSGLLFVLACGLAVFVFALQRRATMLLRQFKTIFDRYTSPIEIADPSGRILYVNSAFEKLSGYSNDHLVGEKGFELATALNNGGSQKSVRENILSASSRGEAWSGEVGIQNRSGEIRTSSVITLPVVDERGRLQEVVFLYHDTTEREKLTQKFEEAREQYQSLVESSLDGIVVVQDEKLVFVNPAAVRIFQYDSQENMTMLNFSDTVAPASRPFLILDYEEKPLGEDLLKNYEMKGLTKNGKLIDVAINARVISWNGKPALHASFRDITERKALERQQAIWLWEQETLSSIDRQLVGIVDLQRVLDIILQHVILLTRAQFVGVCIADTVNGQVHWKATKGNRLPIVGELSGLTTSLRDVLVGRNHFIIDDCRTKGQFLQTDFPILGKEDIITAGFFPLVVNGDPRGKLVVGFRQQHKFSEREIRVLISMAEKISIALTNGELYEDLLRREKELELLSGARVQAQEDERRRIAREIHDGLGQMLTAIKFNLEILEDGITLGEEEKKRVVDIKELLDNVVKEAREISYNLMPSVLDDFGLAPGLQSLCDQFAKGTDLKIMFHAHGLTERLAPEIETGIYRIAQEALNNVAKHAAAKEVEVQIIRLADRLRLTVEDNGKGMKAFPPVPRSLGGGGTGLVSMRERAASFNGTLVIDSTPGKGTTIDVEIPLDSN